MARPCGQGLRAEAWSLVVAAAAGAEECLFVEFFPRDSEVTLGTFGVRFGRVFGTKLGGVLGWRGRVARG